MNSPLARPTPAAMIPGLVRSAVLYGPRDLEEQTLAMHIVGLLRRGIGAAAGGTPRERAKGRRLVSGGVG